MWYVGRIGGVCIFLVAVESFRCIFLLTELEEPVGTLSVVLLVLHSIYCYHGNSHFSSPGRAPD